jgi:AraC-like DNA-binding protein
MRHDLLLQNDAMTPLGRLRLAGAIEGGRGVVPATPLRVYGSYAVACIRRGSGFYRDANGFQGEVAAGTAILVFPELAHWYGTRGRARWDEIYLTFDGPAFDLYRQVGLLDAAHPLRPFPEGWPDRLQRLIEDSARAVTAMERLRHLSAFLEMLTELLAPETDANAPMRGMNWAAQARATLDTDLSLELDLSDVAASVGMTYETFRKRFLKEVGVTPARYRAMRRVEAARELLRYSPHMTNRQAAEALGFADEYHFSRRFTQLTGVSPRQFRGASVRPAERNGGLLSAEERSLAEQP